MDKMIPLTLLYILLAVAATHQQPHFAQNTDDNSVMCLCQSALNEPSRYRREINAINNNKPPINAKFESVMEPNPRQKLSNNKNGRNATITAPPSNDANQTKTVVIWNRSSKVSKTVTIAKKKKFIAKAKAEKTSAIVHFISDGGRDRSEGSSRDNYDIIVHKRQPECGTDSHAYIYGGESVALTCAPCSQKHTSKKRNILKNQASVTWFRYQNAALPQSYGRDPDDRLTIGPFSPQYAGVYICRYGASARKNRNPDQAFHVHKVSTQLHYCTPNLNFTVRQKSHINMAEIEAALQYFEGLMPFAHAMYYKTPYKHLEQYRRHEGDTNAIDVSCWFELSPSRLMCTWALESIELLYPHKPLCTVVNTAFVSLSGSSDDYVYDGHPLNLTDPSCDTNCSIKPIVYGAKRVPGSVASPIALSPDAPIYLHLVTSNKLGHELRLLPYRLDLIEHYVPPSMFGRHDSSVASLVYLDAEFIEATIRIDPHLAHLSTRFMVEIAFSGTDGLYVPFSLETDLQPFYDRIHVLIHRPVRDKSNRRIDKVSHRSRRVPSHDRMPKQHIMLDSKNGDPDQHSELCSDGMVIKYKPVVGLRWSAPLVINLENPSGKVDSCKSLRIWSQRQLTHVYWCENADKANGRLMSRVHIFLDVPTALSFCKEQLSFRLSHSIPGFSQLYRNAEVGSHIVLQSDKEKPLSGMNVPISMMLGRRVIAQYLLRLRSCFNVTQSAISMFQKHSDDNKNSQLHWVLHAEASPTDFSTRLPSGRGTSPSENPNCFRIVSSECKNPVSSCTAPFKVQTLPSDARSFVFSNRTRFIAISTCYGSGGVCDSAVRPANIYENMSAALQFHLEGLLLRRAGHSLVNSTSPNNSNSIERQSGVVRVKWTIRQLMVPYVHRYDLCVLRYGESQRHVKYSGVFNGSMNQPRFCQTIHSTTAAVQIDVSCAVLQHIAPNIDKQQQQQVALMIAVWSYEQVPFFRKLEVLPTDICASHPVPIASQPIMKITEAQSLESQRNRTISTTAIALLCFSALFFIGAASMILINFYRRRQPLPLASEVKGRYNGEGVSRCSTASYHQNGAESNSNGYHSGTEASVGTAATPLGTPNIPEKSLASTNMPVENVALSVTSYDMYRDHSEPDHVKNIQTANGDTNEGHALFRSRGLPPPPVIVNNAQLSDSRSIKTQYDDGGYAIPTLGIWQAENPQHIPQVQNPLFRANLHLPLPTQPNGTTSRQTEPSTVQHDATFKNDHCESNDKPGVEQTTRGPDNANMFSTKANPSPFMESPNSETSYDRRRSLLSRLINSVPDSDIRESNYTVDKCLSFSAPIDNSPLKMPPRQAQTGLRNSGGYTGRMDVSRLFVE